MVHQKSAAVTEDTRAVPIIRHLLRPEAVLLASAVGPGAWCHKAGSRSYTPHDRAAPCGEGVTGAMAAQLSTTLRRITEERGIKPLADIVLPCMPPPSLRVYVCL